MKTFYLGFKGREVGAIGTIDNHYHKKVDKETLKDAVLSLYDNYEHISLNSIEIFEGIKIIAVAKGVSECLRLK